ncbi:MAG: hypothetical protein CMJ31_07810 [Phycisphaerae bacterium]|nr:hypothetical protein [Phycisphaerae bacterium]
MLGRTWLSRVFGSGENPLRWALPLYTLAGIAVRVHVFYIVFLVAKVLFTLPQGAAGVGHVAAILAPMFVLVLLHEYGHCIACRKVGGEASEIIMWPLGGLAMCQPPHDWRSNLITTIGGPAVNAILLVPLGVAVWLTTGEWRSAVFNPFDPAMAFLGVSSSSSVMTWAMIVLVGAHIGNAYLLAFNVLVPMYPMDGGRILHNLLWRSMGYHRATDVTALTGLVVAGVLGVVGIVTNQALLIAIAAFGGIICWQERRNARFSQSGGQDAVIAESQRLAAEEQRERADARKSREAEAKRQEEIDRILAKISEQGMQSLTKKERRTLDEASSKR